MKSKLIISHILTNTNQNMKKQKFKKALVILIISFAVVMTVGVSAFAILYRSTSLDIYAMTSNNTGVYLYDKDGVQLNNLVNGDKEIIDISTLPDYVLNAFIDTEDKRFYAHSGYDIRRIFKAALVNIKSGSKRQGASTITQQLIKNTLLTSDKTYKRKLKELILSIKTEKEFSKDEILDMYLNTIYFGNNSYGIQNASKMYFNKDATKLSIAESATLAGIIKSPARYSPTNNKDNCKKRRDLVLKLMYDNDHISDHEYNEAISSEIELNPYNNGYVNSYQQMALKEASNILNLIEKDIVKGQYQIYTYLDRNVQDMLEVNLQSSVKNIQDYNKITADHLSICCDKNAKILAYVGSSKYDLSEMKRQPASVLKPLAVYLPCMIHNILTPATPINDEPLSGEYSPQNPDKTFHGWINTREAVEKSLNVPAVKCIDYLGVDKSVEFCRSLQLPISDADKNYSLALGCVSDGVKPLSLLSAYSVLYNNGKYTPCRFVEKIVDSDGKIIYQDNISAQQICSDDDAYLMTDMLKTSARSGTAKALNSLDFDVASKTGTAGNSDGNSDLWNISYTNSIALLNWIGDASGHENLPLNITSGKYPTIIAKNTLSDYYKETEKPTFAVPDGIAEIVLDKEEYYTNHKIVRANDDYPERFTFSEIFKVSNLPAKASTEQTDINFCVNLANKKVTLSFECSPTSTYEIHKIVDGKDEIFDTIKLHKDVYSVLDSDSNYEKIQYYIDIITSNDERNSSEIKTVYPNFVSKSRTNSKKKWYV